MKLRGSLFVIFFLLTIVSVQQTDTTLQTEAQVPSPACLGSCPVEPTIIRKSQSQIIKQVIIQKGGQNNSSGSTPCKTVKINLNQKNGLLQKIFQFVRKILGSIKCDSSKKTPPSQPSKPIATDPQPTSAPDPTSPEEPTPAQQTTTAPAPTAPGPTTSVRPPSAANVPLPPGNWRLVWGDDFNGTQLDRTKWDTNSTAYNPYNGYGGPDCRSNPKDHKMNYLTDGENLSFNNGVMTITARRENRGGQPWTSGLITSGRTSGGACGNSEPSNGYIAKKGDYIVKRAKMPAEIGAWGAFWTWGDGSNNGEVDVYEYHSNNARLLEISNRITGGGCNHTMPTNLSQDYHYFGAYLGANGVDFYVDGIKVCSGGPFASNGAALIAVLDISRGTYHPIPPANVNSMQMQIDLIHVYRQ